MLKRKAYNIERAKEGVLKRMGMSNEQSNAWDRTEWDKKNKLNMGNFSVSPETELKWAQAENKRLYEENKRLYEENKRLHEENKRLHEENRRVKLALQYLTGNFKFESVDNPTGV